MPTDTELLKFVLISMRGQCVVKTDHPTTEPQLSWYLKPLPGRSPQEALEAAFLEYRKNLARLDDSPGNLM